MELPSNSERCFACGPLNSRGLKLAFEYNADKQIVESRIILSSEFIGWPGIIHGGIVATILDECAYYAIAQSAANHGSGVTTNINLDFKHPVAPDEPLLAAAWIENTRRQLVYCQTRLYRESDMKLLAQARITYLMQRSANA